MWVAHRQLLKPDLKKLEERHCGVTEMLSVNRSQQLFHW
jgi:hypothetical protein